MGCSSDVLKKTSPLNVFGDVSEKVKHLTNDASNDVSPPALPRSGGSLTSVDGGGKPLPPFTHCRESFILVEEWKG